MDNCSKYTKLPESIIISGKEYFLERFEFNDPIFKGWVGFLYSESENFLVAKTTVKYNYGIFIEHLCSFDENEQAAYNDLLYRINNMITE